MNEWRFSFLWKRRWWYNSSFSCIKGWKQQIFLVNQFTPIWDIRQALEDPKWCRLAYAKIQTEKHLWRKNPGLGVEKSAFLSSPVHLLYEPGHARSHLGSLWDETDDLSQCSLEGLAHSRCSANMCCIRALIGVRRGLSQLTKLRMCGLEDGR